MPRNQSRTSRRAESARVNAENKPGGKVGRGKNPKDREREREEEEELIYTGALSLEQSVRNFDFDDSSEVVNKVANRTYFTVIVYDIVDNKRRTKLAKLLLGYGERVQYSGFEGHLTAKQLTTVGTRIKRLIDEKVDKVRIYKIAGEPQVEIFGSIPLVVREEFTVI